MPTHAQPHPDRIPKVAIAILLFAAAFLAGYAVLAHGDDPPPLALNLMFLVAPSLATLALARAAQKSQGRRRLGWALISASTGAWTLGQVAWAYIEMTRGIVPRPSLADVGYVLTVPLAVLGLVVLWRRQGATWFGARAVLEGAVIGLGLFAVMWSLVLKPASNMGTTPSVLAYAYPVSGVLIMTAALLILPRVSQIDWRRRALLGAALFGITAANAGSLLLASGTGYRIGHDIDLLWMGGFLLLAAFAAYPDRPVQTSSVGEQMASPSVFTFGVVGLAVVSSIADVARQGHLDAVLFGAGVMIVLSLVTLQRLGQLDARDLTIQVATQAAQLARSNENLRLERVRLENAQRVAGLAEWEWNRGDRQFRMLANDGGPPAAAASITLERARIEAEDLAILEPALERVAQNDSDRLDLQVRVRTSEGETRWLRIWNESPELGSGADVRGLVQDITVLKGFEFARIEKLESEAEVRRLREMDKMRATFINVAAHELNTPLTPIKIQLEILRRQVGMDVEALKSFEILQRNVDRLADLVVDLLDSGRLQSGRMKFAFASTDLGLVAADVIESAHETAARAGLSIFFESHGALPVRADARRVHEVVENLVSNALKFTPPGGRIHVIAAREGGDALVRVQDSGIGLTAAGLGLLFHPFSQVDRPVRPHDSGSGLGLFIARGIAVAHGGNVDAQSAGPGKGSTFTLRIPLEAAPSQRAADASIHAVVPDRHRVRPPAPH